MMWSACFFVTFLVACLAHQDDHAEKYMNTLRDFAVYVESDTGRLKEWHDTSEKTDFREGLDIRFDCEVSPSPSEPTSVHELRPGDIDVVAAMGDSVTAGYGIGTRWIVDVLLQQRGESFSIGGDRFLDDRVFTLANVLKKFNPDLKGFSVDIGSSTSENAWLNKAVGGAKAQNMPAQASNIIKAIQEDDRIDLENDWKMVTLFIGGNDLCQYCFNSENLSPANHVANIKEALDRLQAALPRTLVNLIPVFDITPLEHLVTNPLCEILQWTFCMCARNPLYQSTIQRIQKEYYNGLKELVDSGHFDTKDDFTVVLHPGLVEADFPRDPDTGEYLKDYISHDCFHPDRNFHQLMALMLWNSLLVPVGQKPLDFPYDLKDLYAYCPTQENPYVYTSKNSVSKDTTSVNQIKNSVKMNEVPSPKLKKTASKSKPSLQSILSLSSTGRSPNSVLN